MVVFKDADFAAHQTDELFADRQSQAGAAIAPRGRAFGLAERFEQDVRVIRGNADAGVRDLKAKRNLDIPTVGRHVGRPAANGYRALFGEFQGVVDQVDQDLPKPQRITAKPARPLVDGRQGQPEALLRRFRVEQPADLVKDALQVEIDDLKGQLSRLDLGQVEQAVDQGYQRATGNSEHLQRPALAFRKVRAQQQVGHAQDTGERCPELVAHLCQELAFGPAGGLRRFLGLEQLRLDTFLIGDVAGNPDQSHPLAVRGAERCLQRIDDPSTPVRILGDLLEPAGLVAIEDLTIALNDLLHVLRREKIEVGQSDDVGIVPAGQFLERSVAAQIAPLGILEEDQVGHRVDQRQQDGMVVGAADFGLFDRCDVRPHAHAAAVRRGAVRHRQPAAIRQLPLTPAAFSVLLQKVVYPAFRGLIEDEVAGADAVAHHVFKPDAGADEVCRGGVAPPEPVVADDQPVVGVPQRKRLVQPADGDGKPLLGPAFVLFGSLPGRDVGHRPAKADGNALVIANRLAGGFDPNESAVLLDHAVGAREVRLKPAQVVVDLTQNAVAVFVVEMILPVIRLHRPAEKLVGLVAEKRLELPRPPDFAGHQIGIPETCPGHPHRLAQVLLALLQRLLGQLARRDVMADGDDHQIVGALKLCAGDRQGGPDDAAVFGDVPLLDLVVIDLSCDQLLEQSAVGRDVVGDGDFVEQSAEKLGPVVAEHPQEGIIDVQKAATVVRHGDPGIRVLEEKPNLGLFGPELLFLSVLLGHVRQHGDHRAIGRPMLARLDAGAVVAADQEGAAGVAMARHPFRQPSLLTPDGIGDDAFLQIVADDLFECHAGHDVGRVDRAEHGAPAQVADDQPIVGIEQGKAFVNALDRLRETIGRGDKLRSKGIRFGDVANHDMHVAAQCGLGMESGQLRVERLG